MTSAGRQRTAALPELSELLKQLLAENAKLLSALNLQVSWHLHDVTLLDWLPAYEVI